MRGIALAFEVEEAGVFVVVVFGGVLVLGVWSIVGAIAMVSELPKRDSGVRVSPWRYVAIAVLLAIGLGIGTCCARLLLRS